MYRVRSTRRGTTCRHSRCCRSLRLPVSRACLAPLWAWPRLSGAAPARGPRRPVGTVAPVVGTLPVADMRRPGATGNRTAGRRTRPVAAGRRTRPAAAGSRRAAAVGTPPTPTGTWRSEADRPRRPTDRPAVWPPSVVGRRRPTPVAPAAVCAAPRLGTAPFPVSPPAVGSAVGLCTGRTLLG